MKILVTSDWHLDASTAGFDRFYDISDAVDETVQAARDEKVDLYVFLGDLCDPDANRAPRCVAKAIDVARELALESNIRSRWLVGNHDVIEDGSGTSTLTPLEAAFGELSVRGFDPMVRVISHPRGETIDDVTFIWLPYVPRCASYDASAVVREMTFVKGISEEQRHVVVAGHLSIRGQVPGSETQEMGRGRDLWFPVDAVAARWPRAVLMNGHYHRAQQAPIVIPGSLARLTFGEETHTPGFMIVEVG